jgi:hypothetical protein
LLAAPTWWDPLDAQTTDASVGIVLSGITDHRTMGVGSRCTISVSIFGDDIDGESAVQDIVLRKAVDDTGRDLLLPDRWTEPAGATAPSAMGIQEQFQIRSPARRATSIREIDGSIQLFNPTQRNGAVLDIKGFERTAPGPIARPELKRYGIDVCWYTRETFAKFGPGLEAVSEGEASRADLMMIRALLGQSARGRAPYRTVFSIQDPQRRVMSLSLKSADGGSSVKVVKFGRLEFADSQQPLTEDAVLELYLATPEALKVRQFKITNIPLP